MQMDVLVVLPRHSHNTSRKAILSFSSTYCLSNSPNNSFFSKSFTTFCSKKGNTGDDTDEPNNSTGDKFSSDWDKAWSSFKKQGKKKTLSSQFSPNKYVSWNPRRSNFPLSEEVDPIKRTEKSNLVLWTSPRFTLAGAIVIVSLLLVYTILGPTK